MTETLWTAAERALCYLAALPERRVAPTPQAVAALSALDEPLGDAPTPPEEVLRTLDELGSPATMAMAGPRFFGLVVGGALPAALAANWLAGAWDQNAAFANITPGVALLEQVALRWLQELFGLPAHCASSLVTGATMANFTALAAARHAVMRRAGWDVEMDGLIGAPPLTVVVSDEVHPSLIKSLGLLGLGRGRVVRVPTDDQGRLRTSALPALSAACIVCTQVGNVNTGAFDPVGQVCAEAHARGAWVHVDGAFGLWALASPGLAGLGTGVAEADSWATDAHKWLNVPYDSGVAFVRDAQALRAAMAVSAAYLPPPGAQRHPCEYTPELSRRARGVELWAALRSLGRQGVAELVARCCRHAQRFAERMRAAGYAVLNDVVLNQVLVSFGDAETTRRTVAAIQAEGTCWCGATVWQGRTAMRISVSSWATTDEDVERSADAMVAAARGVAV